MFPEEPNLKIQEHKHFLDQSYNVSKTSHTKKIIGPLSREKQSFLFTFFTDDINYDDDGNANDDDR